MVFATGYSYDFPFLPDDLRVKEGYRLSLYKHVFPPNLERPSLAVVGFIHGLGAIIPLAEMQARWATRVFRGAEKTLSKIISWVSILFVCISYTQKFSSSICA